MRREIRRGGDGKRTAAATMGRTGRRMPPLALSRRWPLWSAQRVGRMCSPSDLPSHPHPRPHQQQPWQCHPPALLSLLSLAVSIPLCCRRRHSAHALLISPASRPPPITMPNSSRSDTTTTTTTANNSSRGRDRTARIGSSSSRSPLRLARAAPRATAPAAGVDSRRGCPALPPLVLGRIQSPTTAAVSCPCPLRRASPTAVRTRSTAPMTSCSPRRPGRCHCHRCSRRRRHGCFCQCQPPPRVVAVASARAAAHSSSSLRHRSWSVAAAVMVSRPLLPLPLLLLLLPLLLLPLLLLWVSGPPAML